jgi:pyruvate kinase
MLCLTILCCILLLHPLCMQVVVPRLSTNGLKWHCSGDFVARQCLQYRGVMPVCADPSLGSPDGAILKAALQEVSQ